MPQIIYPWCFVKLAKLYREAKQQAGNKPKFCGFINKQETYNKINHGCPKDIANKQRDTFKMAGKQASNYGCNYEY